MPTSPWSSRLVRVLRHLGRLLAFGALAAAALFCLMLLSLRFYFFPRIDEFRPHIERGLTQAMGQPIAIDRASPAWDGWNPRLVLSGLHVRDRDGRSVLDLPLVDAVVSWRWVLLGELRMKALTLDEPELVVTRDRDGRLRVAGALIEPGSADSQTGIGDWLLRQRVVAIRNGSITWIDEARGAAPLTLERVELRLENGLGHHRFGLSGAAPAALASPLDLRGDLRGETLSGPEAVRGRLYLRLDYADLAAWRQWLPVPVDLVAGAGGVRLWIDIARGAIGEVTGDFDLTGVKLQVAPGRPALAFAALAGRVTAVEKDRQRELRFDALTLRTADGARVAPIDGVLRTSAEDPARVVEAQLAVGSVDLSTLAQLADAFALPPAIRDSLAAHAPSGMLQEGQLRWRAAADGKGSDWSVKGRLQDASLAPHGGVPGLRRASGSFELGDDTGSLQLAASDGRLELPEVFVDAIHFDTMRTRASWRHRGRELAVRIDELAIANADVAASVAGELRLAPEQSTWVDLTATATRADLLQVWRYLPRHVDEKVRSWLHESIVAGKAEEAQMRLKGRLAEVPYARGPEQGEFRVAVKASGVDLRYASQWPVITSLHGDVLLDRDRITIHAADGHILGARIGRVSASAPIIGPAPVLHVEGEASAATREFLRFVRASPVGGWLDHATDAFDASGDARLALRLDIPLHDVAATRVAGELTLRGNRVQPGAGLPALDKLGGTLTFDEREVSARDLVGELLEGPARLSLATAEGKLRVEASGNVDLPRALQALGLPGGELASGRSDWRLAMTVAGRSVPAVELTLPLAGVALDLPPPLGKLAGSAVPLHIEHRALPSRRESWAATLGSPRQPIARLHLVRSDAGGGSLESALLLLGQARAEPRSSGLWIEADLPAVDADRWIDWWERRGKVFAPANADPAAGSATMDPGTRSATTDSGTASATTGSGTASATDSRPRLGGLAFEGFGLRTSALELLGRTVDDVTVKTSVRSTWKARVEARQLAGQVDWQPPRADGPRHGTLTARLSRLDLGDEPDAPGEAHTPAPASATPSQPRDWPAVDLVADSLVSRERRLGKLEVRGGPRGNDWQVERLRLANPDGDLELQGWWRGGAPQRTEVGVVLAVRDAKAFLHRYGYPDAVRGAATSIRGDVSWPGGLRDVDYATMTGAFRIETQAGQFTRVDPGIGKLLGVLNLQALPRRVALDFRDVFSEGFAFDSLTGTVKLDHGVISTDDLRFAGPGARVELAGEANLRDETQRLNVRMYPSLSTGVAVGAAIVNPIAGAAVLLGQKLLQDPVDKLFAMSYQVTGSWVDPQVTRVPSFGAGSGTRTGAAEQPR